MSYSRWLNSRWYTYWAVGGGEVRDEQRFSVCMVGHFTYAELRNDLEGCLGVAMERDGCSDNSEKEELRSYMEQFMRDVEAAFPDNGSDCAPTMVDKK